MSDGDGHTDGEGTVDHEGLVDHEGAVDHDGTVEYGAGESGGEAGEPGSEGSDWPASPDRRAIVWSTATAGPPDPWEAATRRPLGDGGGVDAGGDDEAGRDQLQQRIQAVREGLWAGDTAATRDRLAGLERAATAFLEDPLAGRVRFGCDRVRANTGPDADVALEYLRVMERMLAEDSSLTELDE